MFEVGGDGPTYAVVTDELLRASTAVLEVTATAAAATVESLPQAVGDPGHEGLAAAFSDFCARWDNRLSHLVGDGEEMAARLDACAGAYVENEDDSRGRYQGLMSCAGLSPPAPVGGPVVWPGGL